jgi:hypothetical protein
MTSEGANNNDFLRDGHSASHRSFARRPCFEAPMKGQPDKLAFCVAWPGRHRDVGLATPAISHTPISGRAH